MTSFISTRGGGPVSLSDALFSGLAPDGGLYMPTELQPFPPFPGSVDGLADVGRWLAPTLFAETDPEMIDRVVTSAFSFPVPLVEVEKDLYVLELFHGPTHAFKDVGARFMARLMAELDTGGGTRTVLVATSGDTGSAVAHAFHGLEGYRVIVLFPRDGVSARQRRQMTTLGGNVLALAVRGTFDDCQRLVKQAFADDDLRAHVWLTPANSINLGRLLPQVFYYFVMASVAPEVVSVPSGNFGNLTAGLIARRIGLPVGRFVASTNVNDVVPEYLRSGQYAPRPSIRTVANAMDVGAPSNFERISWLYQDDIEALRRDVAGAAFDDQRVVAEIADVHRRHGYLLDPHGAIAWLGLQQMLEADRSATGVFLATAHPAKFRAVVEPAIGEPVPLPPALSEALARPRSSVPLPASYPALVALLRG